MELSDWIAALRILVLLSGLVAAQCGAALAVR